LHKDILLRSDIFVEYTAQTRIEGEIQQLAKDHPVQELWQVITGQVPGRRSSSQITLFDSVGFATEDFSALRYVRDRVLATPFFEKLDMLADPDDPRDLFGMILRAARGGKAENQGERPMPSDQPTRPAGLIVEDIHKRFGSIEVLKGVSLTAHEHDVVAILGSSGSGKSTFLRCINLLETPDRGRVSINGEQIEMKEHKKGRVAANRKQIERLRARLAMVFQQFNLWQHMTVLQNVIEAPVHVLKLDRKRAIARAEAMLEKVGLANRMSAYPAQLSGGQQQRVAIARALAMEPDVLLFDEPTSALDPELVGEVLKVMRDLAKEGRTMLVVTHEMGFAREVASRVMFLHKGQTEEEGPPDEMFTSPQSERFRQFLSSTLRH
jgi:ABC-type histidine transport system ATPase subunit